MMGQDEGAPCSPSGANDRWRAGAEPLLRQIIDMAADRGGGDPADEILEAIEALASAALAGGYAVPSDE